MCTCPRARCRRTCGASSPSTRSATCGRCCRPRWSRAALVRRRPPRPDRPGWHYHRNMISYRLSEEHEALRATVEEFARDVVAPVIGEYYERCEFPYEIVSRMGKMGLFGLPFPEEYGGMGGDYFALCLALHELARVDSSVAITLEAGVSLGAMPIYRFGTAEQKNEWLPRLCAGERLAAFGLTEPGGGSDVPGGMLTTARLADGHWVIDGAKALITNAGTTITNSSPCSPSQATRPRAAKRSRRSS